MRESIPSFSKIFKVSFFDFQKVQFQAIGLLLGLVLCILCTLVSMKLGSDSIIAQAVNMLGNILLGIVLLLSSAGVAKMIKADLLGESPVSNSDAINFIKKNALAILASPILIILALAAILGLEALLAFIRYIPYIGPIILAVLTIPVVIINVVIAILFVVGVKLVPSIVAVEESSTLETIKLAFQICRVEPLKVAFYAGILTMVGIGIFVLPFIVFGLGLLLTTAFHWTVLRYYSNLYVESWGLMPYIFFGITGFSVLAMGSLVVSLALTYFQGVFTYIYLSFKNKF